MARIRLKAPVLGIDQLSDETSLLQTDDAQALRDAYNVDIDRDGNVSRRKGGRLLTAGSGYHSLYSSKRGWLFACNRDQLGLYDPVSTTFSPLVAMDAARVTSFAELNGNVYAMNGSFSCYFPANSYEAHTLGVALPNTTPIFNAASSGNLPAGTYGVTYTVVAANGEESGTGPITTVTLEEQGGIQGTLFELLTDARYRVYITHTDGEELYEAVEFDASVASMSITSLPAGRRADTKYLEPLPKGHLICAFNSRLFVASTDFVYFSSVFRPHLYRAAHDFIPMTGLVTMIQPVEGGLYVSDKRGVHFLSGEDPAGFSIEQVSTEKAIYGTALSVSGNYFDTEIEMGKKNVAVWLTTSGFNVGLANGELIRMNKEQVRLPEYVQGCAAAIIKDGRKQIVSPVNSDLYGAATIAEDSVIDG